LQTDGHINRCFPIFGYHRGSTLGTLGDRGIARIIWNRMREEYTKRSPANAASRGITLLELILVCAVALCLAAIATPSFLRISYNIRLNSAAANLSGLIQNARIAAAKNNTVYTLSMGTNTACAFNVANNACDGKLPQISFSSTIQLAAAAPTGATGQPTPYSLVGDTSTTTYTNGTTLGYSPRGLPCAYALNTCATPVGGYFVYYLTDTRPGGVLGWAAIVITSTGRSKVVTWNGGSWD
jgi:Tfp pilus assembly protein FimT